MQQSQARLEAISDGIFAFAATLLVVSLDVPDSYSELRSNLGDISSFAISFMALVMLWVVHYNFFRRTTTMDYWVIAYNFAMLFVMLCYIFPLKFLSKLTFGGATVTGTAELSELFQIYGAGFASYFLFLALLYRRAAKSEVNQADYLHYWKRHFLIFSSVALLSILLAFFGVGIRYGLPGFSYCLLGPLCFWHGRQMGVAEPDMG